MPGTEFSSSELDQRKHLVSMLARHQRQLARYIHTLVPHVQDAEDILQETCGVICEKFDTFREGTDFLAWACEIAWWRVRAARTAFARSKVRFSDDVLALVADTASQMREELDQRSDLLAHCMQKLPERDRALIEARYRDGGSVEEAAQHNGRTLEAAYKALARIRRTLHECVSRQALEVPT
ncbi:MAG TPA: sigma-70 family RNA polymerase sigma factor [Phycisphaerae bacterium]|nr:sigma-70 family RNA polymerase sigma factor [Phycisphaerae bacterium]